MIKRAIILLVLLIVTAYVVFYTTQILSTSGCLSGVIRTITTTSSADINSVLIVNERQKLSDNSLIIYFDGYDDKIVFSTPGLKSLNVSDIYIDDALVSHTNVFSRYDVRVDNKFTVIIPKNQFKPSVLNVLLKDKDNKKVCSFDINLVYKFVSPGRQLHRSLWDLKYSDYIKQDDNGIKLMPNPGDKRGYNALTFNRRFEDDIDLEFDFTPLGDPIIFTVNLSQGAQIAIGDLNMKSVRMIRTKKKGRNEWEDQKMTPMSYVPGFIPNHTYTVHIKRTGKHYVVVIKSGDYSQKVIDFEEPDSDSNIAEKYKTIVLAVWRKSKGVYINNVIIFGRKVTL